MIRKLSKKKAEALALAGKPWPRSSITASRKAPRKRNPKRKASEFTRCYGSKERVVFVRGMDCICATTKCSRCIDNAHICGDGAGRKASYGNIVPICRYHHGMLHEKGVAWFEEIYSLDLQDEADRVERLWLEYSN